MVRCPDDSLVVAPQQYFRGLGYSGGYPGTEHSGWEEGRPETTNPTLFLLTGSFLRSPHSDRGLTQQDRSDGLSFGETTISVECLGVLTVRSLWWFSQDTGLPPLTPVFSL